MSDMKKTVTCKYCSAEYPEELANCPYCGNVNFYGQEKIYMQRMSQIRKRLASLAYIDKKIILKESRINDDSNISNWSYEFWLKMFKLYNSNMVSKDKKVLVNNSYKRMLEHESSLEKIHRNRKQNNRK